MKKVFEALAQAADGACGVDQTQRIVFWNSAAERIMGYQAEEVSGRRCYEIFCGKPRPGCLACGPECPVMLAASRDQMLPLYNLLSQTKHGTTLLLNVSIIVLPASARPLVIINLFRDVSRQLQYESYVEEMLRAAARLPAPQALPSRAAVGESGLSAPLTAREQEVLYLLLQGKASCDIATVLGLSYATVRNYLQSILHKFGVHSQREVFKLAHERHLV
jgi:DNA-binding CsgD family transcriptional regulator